MPSDTDRAAMQSIYFEALSRFKPETIVSCVNLFIATNKYPALDVLVKLCEEKAATNRYQEFPSLGHEPKKEPSLDEIPPGMVVSHPLNPNEKDATVKIVTKEAKDAIDAMRELVKKMTKGSRRA